MTIRKIIFNWLTHKLAKKKIWLPPLKKIKEKQMQLYHASALKLNSLNIIYIFVSMYLTYCLQY